jgi:cell division protein FtsI (penicillin-binding protein 3)
VGFLAACATIIASVSGNYLTAVLQQHGLLEAQDLPRLLLVIGIALMLLVVAFIVTENLLVPRGILSEATGDASEVGAPGTRYGDVFISASPTDQSIVESIGKRLEHKGIRFFDSVDFTKRGDPDYHSIEDAIRDSSIFLLVLSEPANRSTAVLAEAAVAFNSGISVISIHLSDVCPSTSIQKYIKPSLSFNAADPPEDAQLDALIEVVLVQLLSIQTGADDKPDSEPVSVDPILQAPESVEQDVSQDPVQRTSQEESLRRWLHVAREAVRGAKAAFKFPQEPEAREADIEPAAPIVAALTKTRAAAALGVLSAVAFLLCLRLFDIQVLEGPNLAQAAFEEHARVIETRPIRGSIMTRDGVELVQSGGTAEVVARPREVRDQIGIARTLAPILAVPVHLLEYRLRSPLYEVRLASGLSPAAVRQIYRLNLTGIELIAGVPKRVYSSGLLAANTIGHIGPDGRGAIGIEKRYDRVLSGERSVRRLESDLFGRPIASGGIIQVGRPGSDVVLALDSSLQAEVERILYAAIRSSAATGGAAIVMNPRTGEIIALASLPDYDLDHADHSTSNQRRNRALDDTFEPGAAFSAVSVAAGLESGHFSDDVPVSIDPRLILRALVRPSTVSLEDIVVKSDLAGLAMIAITVGTSGFDDSLRLFGLGVRTGVDLPGESSGSLPAREKWSLSDLESYAAGEHIRVTPLQLVNAYAAIAADGQLPRPHVVVQITGGQAAQYNRDLTTPSRRSCSVLTASTVRRYMQSAHERGPFKAIAPGLAIAGSAVSTIDTGAFVGMFPVDKPYLVALLKLDGPGSNTVRTAATAFGQIVTSTTERHR